MNYKKHEIKKSDLIKWEKDFAKMDHFNQLETIKYYLVEFYDYSFCYGREVIGDNTDFEIVGDLVLVNVEIEQRFNKYEQGKEQARREAQTLQIYQGAISWGELAQQCEHLEKLARRYGLLKEFRNEGII